ncbi:unnamed protein product [Cochlearia groenlandica]
MAGTRDFDEKFKQLLEGHDEFFTTYDDARDSFDAMALQENLLRGFEKPCAAVIQSGTGKTASLCSGVLQQHCPVSGSDQEPVSVRISGSSKPVSM